MKAVAWFLILLGSALIILILWPVLKEEAKYNFDKAAGIRYVVATEQTSTFQKPLIPPNTNYSIIIPKIGAVSRIIDGVDPTDPNKYLPALTKGVAHADGTAQPGEKGNVYLFAHSTDAFWHVNTYNAIFYLIGKLNSGDEIDIYYQDNLYQYKVYDKKVVEPNDSKYLGVLIPDAKTLTLQTCYPPGTTFKRLVVLAKQVSP